MDCRSPFKGNKNLPLSYTNAEIHPTLHEFSSLILTG